MGRLTGSGQRFWGGRMLYRVLEGVKLRGSGLDGLL